MVPNWNGLLEEMWQKLKFFGDATTFDLDKKCSNKVIDDGVFLSTKSYKNVIFTLLIQMFDSWKVILLR
jgi:hypothetical protein